MARIDTAHHGERQPRADPSISTGGDRYLRTLLIHGARAMLVTTSPRNVAARPWLQSLVARRPMNGAAVAVAHKAGYTTASTRYAVVEQIPCKKEAVLHVVLLEEDRADEADYGLIVGEEPDDIGAPFDLAVHPFEWVRTRYEVDGASVSAAGSSGWWRMLRASGTEAPGARRYGQADRTG